MKLKKYRKPLIIACSVIVLLFGAALLLWVKINGDSVVKEHTVYVPTGADYTTLIDALGSNGEYIRNLNRFNRLAQVFSLDKRVRPGKYTLRPGMSYIQTVKMFRNGIQTPVRLTFNNIRTIPQLAGRLSQQIEADSITLLSALTSDTTAASMGFTPQTFIGMFIPDTYELWWTTTPDGLLERMKKEYDRFWNEERLAKLEKTGLTRDEAMTLASIVYEESKKSDEMPVIAGVYINRLRIGMPLQADPSVKFAIGDFAIKRILHKHLEVDSPYNTYKYAGLPPGPISMPSVKAIDAVLDFKKHDYIYFCAKPDFSGYHSFAVTLDQHNRNAQAYYNALNRAGIR